MLKRLGQLFHQKLLSRLCEYSTLTRHAKSAWRPLPQGRCCINQNLHYSPLPKCFSLGEGLGVRVFEVAQISLGGTYLAQNPHPQPLYVRTLAKDYLIGSLCEGDLFTY